MGRWIRSLIFGGSGLLLRLGSETHHDERGSEREGGKGRTKGR